MNIAIIDDMITDCNNLTNLISEILHNKDIDCNIYSYTKVLEFLECDIKFDAVFMDILMPDKTGMETARELRKTKSEVPIIFVTTEKSFALEGYEVQAFDYIIKPVDINRLKVILNRLTKLYNNPRSIVIRKNRQRIEIPVKDIIYAEARGHNVDIFTTNEIYTAYMSFKELTSLFANEKHFKVCNRGILINFERIKRLQDNYFVTDSGVNVQISRSKAAEMKNEYVKYVFNKTRRELN
ncbi:MAG: LytTR family DNA-binding domain-containing protein [Clostridia bacterium]|nr:LytTR family DNA-binding domain-containing protein [Clostridia bacterium]